VYGSFSGFHTHPTELTVSHTPTKCKGQLRQNVALKAVATSKMCVTFSGSCPLRVRLNYVRDKPFIAGTK
jgi:hypothetical protein